MRINVKIQSLNDDALDRQEALCLRLLLCIDPANPVSKQLYRRLCAVRHEMFERVQS